MNEARLLHNWLQNCSGRKTNSYLHLPLNRPQHLHTLAINFTTHKVCTRYASAIIPRTPTITTTLMAGLQCIAQSATFLPAPAHKQFWLQQKLTYSKTVIPLPPHCLLQPGCKHAAAYILSLSVRVRNLLLLNNPWNPNPSSAAQAHYYTPPSLPRV